MVVPGRCDIEFGYHLEYLGCVENPISVTEVESGIRRINTN